MKYSAGMTRLVPTIGFLSLFCLGASLQALAMKRAEMGSVYVLVLGLEAIVVFLLSAAVLGERVSLAKAGAVALIVGGILLLKRG